MDTSEETPQNEYILRPMNCELNQLSMPDGSAMLMQGRLCLLSMLLFINIILPITFYIFQEILQ